MSLLIPILFALTAAAGPGWTPAQAKAKFASDKDIVAVEIPEYINQLSSNSAEVRSLAINFWAKRGPYISLLLEEQQLANPSISNLDYEDCIQTVVSKLDLLLSDPTLKKKALEALFKLSKDGQIIWFYNFCTYPYEKHYNRTVVVALGERLPAIRKDIEKYLSSLHFEYVNTSFECFPVEDIPKLQKYIKPLLASKDPGLRKVGILYFRSQDNIEFLETISPFLYDPDMEVSEMAMDCLSEIEFDSDVFSRFDALSDTSRRYLCERKSDDLTTEQVKNCLEDSDPGVNLIGLRRLLKDLPGQVSLDILWKSYTSPYQPLKSTALIELVSRNAPDSQQLLADSLVSTSADLQLSALTYVDSHPSFYLPLKKEIEFAAGKQPDSRLCSQMLTTSNQALLRSWLNSSNPNLKYKAIEPALLSGDQKLRQEVFHAYESISDKNDIDEAIDIMRAIDFPERLTFIKSLSKKATVLGVIRVIDEIYDSGDPRDGEYIKSLFNSSDIEIRITARQAYNDFVKEFQKKDGKNIPPKSY